MFTRLALTAILGAAFAFGTAINPVDAAPLKEFRVGYQKGAAILVIAKQREAFEQRLKQLGVEHVEWVEFQFGPPLLEALGAGAVDIGMVGDTPPVFAQAAGADLVYVASAPASSNAIVVPQESAIQKVADLKGKKVAIAKGSSSHNLTIQALNKYGLSFGDIEPIYLAPADAVAAFTTGQVDAWTIWDPYLALAEIKHGGRAIVTTDEEGLGSNSFYLTNRSFAENHPDVLQAIVSEIKSVSDWAAQNLDQLARISSEVTGVDLEAQTIASNRIVIDLLPITEETIVKQQKVADTFADLGLIPRKINVRDIVWTVPTN